MVGLPPPPRDAVSSNTWCRTNNATIEVIIEGDGFNNSLAGYDNCDNANGHLSRGGKTVANTWIQKYLKKGE